MALDLGLALGQGVAGLATGVESGVREGRSLAARGSQAESQGLQFAISTLLGREREAHRLEFEKAKEALRGSERAEERNRPIFEFDKLLSDSLNTTARQKADAMAVYTSPNAALDPTIRENARKEAADYENRIRGLELARPAAKRLQDAAKALPLPEAKEYAAVGLEFTGDVDKVYSTPELESFIKKRITGNPLLSKNAKAVAMETIKYEINVGHIRVKDKEDPQKTILQMTEKVGTAIRGKSFSAPEFMSANGQMNPAALVAGITSMVSPQVSQLVAENLGNPRLLQNARMKMRFDILKDVRATKFYKDSTDKASLENEIINGIGGLFDDAEEQIKIQRPLEQEDIGPGAALPPGFIPPEAGALPGTELAQGFEPAPGAAPAPLEPSLTMAPQAPAPPRGPDLRLAQSPRVRNMVTKLTQGMFVPVDEQNLLAEMVAGVFDEGDLDGVT